MGVDATHVKLNRRPAPSLGVPFLEFSSSLSSYSEGEVWLGASSGISSNVDDEDFVFDLTVAFVDMALEYESFDEVNVGGNNESSSSVP